MAPAVVLPCATVRTARGAGMGRLVQRGTQPARGDQAVNRTAVLASPGLRHEEDFSEMYRKGTSTEANPVPEENGPVRWTLSNSFFRVGETELEEANPEDAGKVILSIGLLSP